MTEMKGNTAYHMCTVRWLDDAHTLMNCVMKHSFFERVTYTG